MQIRGVVHPAPGTGEREVAADLSAAEISLTNLTGRPLLDEHDGKKRVGTCLASWEGKCGDLRVAATVDSPSMQKRIANGSMRGLSLGTELVSSADDRILYRGQVELSVCAEGRRAGTWIDTIDGKRVYRTHRASKGTLTAFII